MPQGFNYNEPAPNADLVSLTVRTNFQALATFHKGSVAPTGAGEGYAWLDDSDSNNVQLKRYYSGQWRVEIEHVESIPQVLGIENTIEFYEGVNPPPMIDIDDYNFEDAAGFSPDSDNDIIFRLEPEERYSLGLKLILRYMMSTAHTGIVRLKLDYRIKNTGDPSTGGTNYTQTFSVDPVNVAEQTAFIDSIQIPSGRISASTEAVHLRLTRLGTDPLDTHDGIFGMMSIQPKVL